MKKRTFIGAALLATVLAATAAKAGDYEVTNPAAFAKAFAPATVSIDQALKTAQAQGTPISAKYELDDKGALALSVYVMKSPGQFAELLIDYKSGAIAKNEVITDKGDIADATGQATAVGAAKMSLVDAATKAVADNPGYKVISFSPEMRGPNPFAEIFVIKDTDVKKTAQKLN